MPKVSIVTCTYNRAHLIGETIKSVLEQSYTDFEYIIIDDGSEDDTASVVKSFPDPRIKYYPHTRTNGHLSALRNYAHTQCSGDYIAYVDSDDLWEKDKLAIQLASMERNQAIGFSFTDIVIFNQEGVLRKSLYKKSGEFAGSVFSQMLDNKLIICHTTLVIRRSCLEEIGAMDEAMHSGDHDLVFYLSRHFDAFVVFRPLVRVRKHPQNSTADPSLSLRLLEEHHQTLRKLYRDNLISGKEFKKAYARTSYSFGIQASAIGNYVAARHYFSECLASQPFFWKARVRIALLPK